MEKLNAPNVDKLKLDKAVNEFTMARDLCNLFDTDPYLSATANQIAACALNILNSVNQQIASGDQQKMATLMNAARAAYVAENKLKMWTPGVSALLGSSDQPFTVAKNHIAAMCADKGKRDSKIIGEILRLFGGVAENLHLDPKTVPAGHFTSAALTLAVPTAPADKPATVGWDFFCSTRPAYRTTAYGNMAFDRKARQRTTPPNFNAATIEKEVADVLGLDYQNVKTGNTFFRPLLPGDIVRSIDKVLGLPEGASISGTTSDTIWAVEVISNFLNGQGKSFDPNILLLPLAAIVAGYHHTALEVGLAMTINGYITYQPGFYTSFQDSEMSKTAWGARIHAILANAENDGKNLLMLIATDSTPNAVYAARSEDDKKKFRKAVTLDFDGYKKWYGLAQPATSSPSSFPVTFSVKSINDATSGLLN